MSLKEILVDIQQALRSLQDADSKGNIADFKTQKQEGAKMLLKGAVQRLLDETRNDLELHSLAQKLSVARNEEMTAYLEKIAEIAADIPQDKKSFRIPRLPSEINDEVATDLREIQTCMNAACYRSAVILCGRIMETVLHRKYYEATQNDLLEKNQKSKEKETAHA